MKLKNWKLVNSNYNVETEIPFSLQSDLENNGYIDEILKNKNEQLIQKLDKDTWTYETQFNLEELKEIKIIFKKIDVLANIYINGYFLATCNNFFIPHEFNIAKNMLKIGDNNVQVIFESTTVKGQEKIKEQGYNLPAINDTSQMGQIHDDKVSVHFRKPPYHYGWDWGPRIVSVGIYDDVYIVEQNYKEFDFNIDYKLCDKKALITITPNIELKNFDLFLDGVKQKADIVNNKLHFTIENFELWWPNGYGSQKLYNIEIANIDSKKSKKIGLRTIELIRENDQFGKSFDFYVNGVKMFMKGANRIPSEVLYDKLDYRKIKWELKTAQISNNNMIRVWGGGIYEPDYFYDLCDEYGLIVWQDFMFACSMYPGNKQFIKNISDEVKYIVKHLKDRTCIGLFCGNNEMSMAWTEGDMDLGWGWKQRYTKEQREKIYNSYNLIFNEVIHDIVTKNSDIAYWNSSPWNENDFIPLTNKNITGDSHYWGVWHQKDKVEEYDNNISRFVSEYGMQSFPNYELLKKYVSSEKLYLLSDEIMLRQKSGEFGNELIKTYVEELVGDTNVSFEKFCYLSQVNQADAMHKALTLHRLNKYKCGGSLYWQLNDVWPGATWSSMQYDGKWKAAQYYIKEACESILPIIKVEDNIANIFILNDSLSPKEVECEIQFIDQENIIKLSEKHIVKLDTNKNKFIAQYYLKNNFENCYVKVIVDKKESILLVNKPKNMELKVPTIKWELIEKNDEFYIMIKSNSFSPYTEIITDNQDIFLEENFIHLESGVEKFIKIDEKCNVVKIRTLLGE